MRAPHAPEQPKDNAMHKNAIGSESPDTVSTPFDVLPPALPGIVLVSNEKVAELNSSMSIMRRQKSPSNSLLLPLFLVVFAFVGLPVTDLVVRNADSLSTVEAPSTVRIVDRAPRAWTFPATFPRDPDGVARSLSTAFSTTFTIAPLGPWLASLDIGQSMAVAAGAWSTSPPREYPLPAPMPLRQRPSETENDGKMVSPLMKYLTLAMRPDLVMRDCVEGARDCTDIVMLETSFGSA